MLATDKSYTYSVHEPILTEQDVLQWASTLKREAPVMAKAQESRDKQRRLNTTTRTATPKRKRSNAIAFFRSPSAENDAEHRRQQEMIKQIHRETEELRILASQQRASADANLELDKVLLGSFGLKLPVSGFAETAATTTDNNGGTDGICPRGDKRHQFEQPRPQFDPASPSFSHPLFSATEAAGVAALQEEAVQTKEYEARRRKAEATLTATEYRCWVIRDEMFRDRRKQDNMWAKVFNGDPLAVPPSGVPSL